MTQETYTERDVEMLLRGMNYARKIARQSGKGLIASTAIAKEIQTFDLYMGARHAHNDRNT